jgi:hypothetical protein
MAALKKKLFALKILNGQRGIALIGTIVAVTIVIAFLMASGLKYTNIVSNVRGQARRQLAAQEVFQNAAMIVYKAYELAYATNPTVCPSPGTVLRRTPGGPMSTSVTLCLPTPVAPTPLTPSANCVANPELQGNYICLDLVASGTNGILTFSPLPDKRGPVARVIDGLNSISERLSLSPGFSQADAAVNTLPPMPAFASYPWLPVPIVATAGVTCGGALYNCVNIRICLQATSCPVTPTNDLNYYQTIAFPVK